MCSVCDQVEAKRALSIGFRAFGLITVRLWRLNIPSSASAAGKSETTIGSAITLTGAHIGSASIYATNATTPSCWRTRSPGRGFEIIETDRAGKRRMRAANPSEHDRSIEGR